MYAFDYVRPGSVNEAVRLLTENDDAKALAGGMTLIPVMKQRLAMPSHLVDLGGLTTLKAITAEAGIVTIGAMTPHVAVADSPVVQQRIPALAELAGGIGDGQVRNRGTLGGSIANNDPAADYTAAVVALDATIRTDRREIAADAFFTGMFETALEPGELITHVRFPVPQAAGYVKFAQQASRYALVGVMVARTAAGVRVAVTGAGPCVFRVAAMEAALEKSFTPAAVEGIQVPADRLNSDIHGSADYRAHLVTVMAKRAVAAAA